MMPDDAVITWMDTIKPAEQEYMGKILEWLDSYFGDWPLEKRVRLCMKISELVLTTMLDFSQNMGDHTNTVRLRSLYKIINEDSEMQK